MTASGLQIDYADFVRRVPEINGAMYALGAAVDASGLAKDLTELVKLRASQINGCAFCVQLHRNVAALAWTERLTAGIAEGITAAERAALATEFSESEIVHLTVTVGTINQWNRISMGLGFGPSAATA